MACPFGSRERVGENDSEMAVEYRVFAHSVSGGSWLEHKLVKGRWVRCVFLVLDEINFDGLLVASSSCDGLSNFTSNP